MATARPQEMDAYRLYTVVPFLVKFIENLTNIYVGGGDPVCGALGRSVGSLGGGGGGCFWP